LGTSEITIRIHRGEVMRKMKAHSLADLVRMAGHLGVQ
jgi:FixJ family two-component response regulator